MEDRFAEANVCRTRRGILVAGVSAPLWLPDLARSIAQEDPAPPPSRQSARDKIILTIVYDNNPSAPGLTAEWGFGCLIQGPEKTILFDTGGAGWILLANLRRLKLDPREVDAVVLSHIHWDHTGGLTALSLKRTGIPVYIPTGFPAEFKEHVQSLGAEPIEADKSLDICPQVRTTGTLGKGAIEEHGLCVKTKKGWVLLTGCAHPGADNMAKRAERVTGGPIHLVAGGFHMIRQPESNIDAVIDRFEELGVHRAAPTHCSGDETRRVFKDRLGSRCRLVGVGDTFRFQAPDTA